MYFFNFTTGIYEIIMARKYPTNPVIKCFIESLYGDCFWILNINRLEIKTKLKGINIIGEINVRESSFL